MVDGSRAGTMFGRYQLQVLLARGGMGEVYRAYDTVKGRTVALKLLPEEFAKNPGYPARFRREAHAAARLQEPHVIPIHDWGEIDGLLYIDMRLVEGSDLRTLLTRGGPMPPARAVQIVIQIAAALDAAHTAGLVHRDVKPENILITGDRDNEFAYLVDFGIASDALATQLTTAGSIIGTYAYMAPERFDDVPVTGRSDIYSLACVLYEALAGAKPYPASTISGLIKAHLTSPVPRVSTTMRTIPVGFDAVIARGMAKDPADRYASAGQFASAAQSALTHDNRHTARTIAETTLRPTTAMPTIEPTTFDPAPPDREHAVPQQTGPTQQPKPSHVVPVLMALLLVGMLAVGGVVAWLVVSQGNSGQASSAAGTSTTTAALPVPVLPPVDSRHAPTAPNSRQAPTAPNVETPVPVPAPAPAPETARLGDLGLAIPMAQPRCDGTGIVVVGSAITPGQYAEDVQRFLVAHPESSYLRTDQACPSLRQATDEGNPIYAVYKSAGKSTEAVCTLVRAVGGDAYGKWLDMYSDPTFIIPCP
ncbi:serine/threonine-protein kinase [Rhodococcus jostii]|uniref:non-specific serine/threonine protein kinase n=1 Tax=Rhodococcus jostii TaxID=132919 RepID=A0A1H4IU49_RHOJO|nr:serine/threonine-protein kinase [Rhodococcus jostii]SEB37589.1 serine/threonine protein kinase [Rhodococcus jostii]